MDADAETVEGREIIMLKTLDQILTEGIKEQDWTYCKKEYAPDENCKVGMPEEFTTDGTKKPDVTTLYIVTAKYRTGDIIANTDYMYLSDGRFYWYDNLWEDEIVDQEKTDEWFMEPIAWVPYRNVPERNICLPTAPCNEQAVPTPPLPEFCWEENNET